MNLKTAIVTGASRGIGYAVAVAMAKEGYNLIVQYNNSESEAKALLDETSKFGSQVILVKADISDSQQAKMVANTAIDKWGQIDVLVNNAGIVKDRSFIMMTEQEWHDVINVNLNGTFNMTKSCIYEMYRKRHGAIINITSVAGIVGIAGQTNYCASKAGIVGFSKALAVEMAPFGIRVNCVAPGYINTDMTNNMPNEKKNSASKRIPLARFGNPDEISDTVCFLAGEKASYITGKVFEIDGGMVS